VWNGSSSPAEQRLVAVVDRTERAERGALAVGRLADRADLVLEGDVEAAVTLPGADKAGERTELRSCGHGHGG
jgi:hypothetical protein